MNYIEIVTDLLELNDELFLEMKSILLEKYITFSIIDNNNITKELLCEKLCDYIEKIMIKEGLSFNDLLKEYKNSFKSLLLNRLGQIQVGVNKKGKEIYEDSRALKFFNQALRNFNDKTKPYVGLEDFSRISLCLYNETIKSKRNIINDFDFSFKDVKCQMILNAIESESVTSKNIFAKSKTEKRFKSDEKYSKDVFFLLMTVIMFYHLKNQEIEEEY